MRKCAYDKCGIEFEPSTHNQRYHTSECCRQATNARMIQNYYEKKARQKGRLRVCATCNTILSRYNEDKICGKCQAEQENLYKDDLLRMLSRGA